MISVKRKIDLSSTKQHLGQIIPTTNLMITKFSFLFCSTKLMSRFYLLTEHTSLRHDGHLNCLLLRYLRHEPSDIIIECEANRCSVIDVMNSIHYTSKILCAVFTLTVDVSKSTLNYKSHVSRKTQNAYSSLAGIRFDM